MQTRILHFNHRVPPATSQRAVANQESGAAAASLQNRVRLEVTQEMTEALREGDDALADLAVRVSRMQKVNPSPSLRLSLGAQNPRTSKPTESLCSLPLGPQEPPSRASFALRRWLNS